MGSLMMISPLRILMLYRHDGFVQTQALYSIEAPWLPKSESGTRSPSLHLRHRGNAFSTKSPPSLLSGGYKSPTSPVKLSEAWRRSKPRGSLRLCIRIPTADIHSPCHRYHTILYCLCQHTCEEFFILLVYYPERHSLPQLALTFKRFDDVCLLLVLA